MNHDQTFRAVLIVVFLLVLPIGIYHRLKSQATREKLDRGQEGLFILATLRPVGVVGDPGPYADLVLSLDGGRALVKRASSAGNSVGGLDGQRARSRYTAPCCCRTLKTRSSIRRSSAITCCRTNIRTDDSRPVSSMPWDSEATDGKNWSRHCGPST